MATLGFCFESYRLKGSGKPSLGDYSWWLVAVKLVCSQATSFEIRCRRDEPEAIETGRRFGAQIEDPAAQGLVFRGDITDAFRQELVTRYLFSGCLRWLGLTLYKNTEPLFLSEEYGTEICLPNLTNRQLAQLKALSGRYPAIAQVRVYQAAQSS